MRALPLLLLMASLTQSLIIFPSCSLDVWKSRSRKETPRLFALGKSQNKQAELARKLEEAKRQQRDGRGNLDGSIASDSGKKYAADENRRENEPSEFATLLAKVAPRPEPKDYDDMRSDRGTDIAKRKISTRLPPSGSAGLIKASVKRRKKVSPASQTVLREDEVVALGVGDEAKRRHFEALVCSTTKLPLGPLAAAQLVPWVPPHLSRSLIVLADPRKRSSELKSAIGSLLSFAQDAATLGLPPCTIVAITSDTPEEITGWLKRLDAVDSRVIRVFSDVKLEWMKRYSAEVGRWTLTFYAIDDDGIIQRLVREVEPSQCSRLVSEYLQTIRVP